MVTEKETPPSAGANSRADDYQSHDASDNKSANTKACQQTPNEIAQRVNTTPFDHLKQTPLLAQHLSLNAKIVDFGGWALPVNYGSQIEEHHAVRNSAGIFDVSHMTVCDISGSQTLDLLRLLLANSIDKITHTCGKALYSCMLNKQAGVIDDLIVYYLNDEYCRIVSNAGTNAAVMAWINKHSKKFDTHVVERSELALIAIQGPKALALCEQILPTEFNLRAQGLQRFQGALWGDEFIGRTGYTGEDGVELIINNELAQELWQIAIAKGVGACGLGARDTLRLESAMALYGNELDEEHTPIESGLKWSVSMNDSRDFIGKTALHDAPRYQSIGLVLKDKGVIRGGQELLLNDKNIGHVTSGTFSPTLQQSIGLARINANTKLSIGDELSVAVRNKQLSAVVAKTPFVKNGVSTNSPTH